MALEDLVIRGGRFSLLQERDYWQYETYVERFRPDTVGREAAFNRFVKFPYPEDVRLDSLVEGQEHRHVLLFPSSENPRDLEEDARNASGAGLGRGRQRLPSAAVRYVELRRILDALLRRYRAALPHPRSSISIVTVEDRNYIQFFVGDTRVVDTLGDNWRQLDKITGLMRQIVEQQEFWVDTITLTAASSPEGAYAFNDRLSQGRARGAQTLPCPPIRQKH